MLKTGEFNRRISVLAFGKEPLIDEEGFSEKNWRVEATVWASVKTVQGREFYQAASPQKERTTRFIVRYSNRMDTLLKEKSLRIRYKDRLFDVKSVINDNEANVTFTIMTEEVM
ncbi:phage head closure protein [Bacillus paralicheniformis]|uniref:phage head closure protein n=1 Tax=Bacillus paralicheniformis TaxID=1648923 RepID=UPI001F1012FF|nr:phage head closure protein [Bacillus paralicheniformis]